VHAGAGAVPEPVIRAMAAAGLDGLEVDHPDQPPPDRAHWRGPGGRAGRGGAPGPCPPPGGTAWTSPTPTSRPRTGPTGGPWRPSWAWRRPAPPTATAPSTATVLAAGRTPTGTTGGLLARTP